MTQICTLAQQRAKRCVNERTKPIPEFSLARVREDADALHDLRVACRRTRVALAEFSEQISPGPRRRARDAFREIRRRLGEARELDVNLERLEEFREAHPAAVEFAKEQLARERAAAIDSLGDLERVLEPHHVRALLETLGGAYRPTTDCYRKQGGQRLRKRLKRLSQRYRAWRETGHEDDLHDLRIQFKKMRYTLEIYSDLYGKDGKKALLDLEAAQDALGDWNDYRMLRDHLKRFDGELNGSMREAVNELIGDTEAAVEGQMKAVRKQTGAFFKKNRVSDLKKMFGKPQRPCCDKTR
jgi:CHAD domain-containing protein